MAPIIDAFHPSGATYGRKNRRCEFRTPRDQAETTRRAVIGNRIRTSSTVRACRSGSNPAKRTATRSGATRMPRKARGPGRHGQEAEDRAREPCRVLLPLVAQEPGVDRNEGRGERALTHQVLEDVRGAERGAPHVRDRRGPEVVGEDGLTSESRDPAHEDAGRHTTRGPGAMPGAVDRPFGGRSRAGVREIPRVLSPRRVREHDRPGCALGLPRKLVRSGASGRTPSLR